MLNSVRTWITSRLPDTPIILLAILSNPILLAALAVLSTLLRIHAGEVIFGALTGMSFVANLGLGAMSRAMFKATTLTVLPYVSIERRQNWFIMPLSGVYTYDVVFRDEVVPVTARSSSPNLERKSVIAFGKSEMYDTWVAG